MIVAVVCVHQACVIYNINHIRFDDTYVVMCAVTSSLLHFYMRLHTYVRLHIGEEKTHRSPRWQTTPYGPPNELVRKARECNCKTCCALFTRWRRVAIWWGPATYEEAEEEEEEAAKEHAAPVAEPSKASRSSPSQQIFVEPLYQQGTTNREASWSSHWRGHCHGWVYVTNHARDWIWYASFANHARDWSWYASFTDYARGWSWVVSFANYARDRSWGVSLANYVRHRLVLSFCEITYHSADLCKPCVDIMIGSRTTRVRVSYPTDRPDVTQNNTGPSWLSNRSTWCHTCWSPLKFC